MKQTENEVLEFINSLQHLYLEERDIDAILEKLDNQILWIGIGGSEACHGIEEVRQILTAQKQECDSKFIIKECCYENVFLFEDTCLVFGELWAESLDDITVTLHYQLSAVCVKTELGTRLSYLHLSLLKCKQDADELYVKMGLGIHTFQTLAGKTNEELEKRNKMLEMLTQNVPGGVHNCLNDSFFTLLNANDGFLKLTGYTKNEIAERFDNHFIEMIHPDDREHALHTAGEQLQRGNTVEFEYRLIRKDGSTLWVFDRGRLETVEDGTQIFSCMLLDVSSRKNEQEQLRLSLERHQVIMDQTTDIIFEWDIHKDTLAFSSNWLKKFGYMPIKTNISDSIPLSINIHPNDMSSFVKIMKDTSSGVPYAETEFQICNVHGVYIWCRIRATTQFDINDKPIKVVGVIIDIDEGKKHEQKLLEQAETDGLTGLLNKHAVQLKINNYLENFETSGFHAMLMVDLDHFKVINDSYGHLSGDAALSDAAGILKRLLRSSDIVGRIGGDEFLIFMPNVDSREIVEKKVQEISQEFRMITLWGGDDVHLSISVGIAIFPDDALDYMELYRCADIALYHVKNKGRCGSAFYCNSMETTRVAETVAMSAAREKIDSDIGNSNQTLDQYTFRMLHGAANTEIAIKQILEIVGRAYGVSRIYIIENDQDIHFCSNTFEWCDDGISSQIDNMQNLSYESRMAGYQTLFDEHGIFYCTNIQTLESSMHSFFTSRNVRSTLQCAITEDEQFVGSVGFDQCHKDQKWSAEQIDSFSLIACVISTFLIKMRLKDQITLLKKESFDSGKIRH